MKLLQINTVVNSGSTGKIAEDIGNAAIQAGFESYIAAGYTGRTSNSKVLTIGGALDRNIHGVKSLLLDRHGFGSGNATRAFVQQLTGIRPSLVHLHNIHGYYLHVGVLFQYLKQAKLPVIWTLHDCWPFTGHCSFFDRVNCSKWQTTCHQCPNQKGYPASRGLDQSRQNFKDKKLLFNGIDLMQIVVPSHWLAGHVAKSFLQSYPVQVIHNGVDTALFTPTAANESVRSMYELDHRPIVLGVASTWDKRKGLADFVAIHESLGNAVQMVLVGLDEQQLKALPAGMKGIRRTESSDQLAALYAIASVFVNPTTVDNFPTTNIEALACGTPVITYDTGGSAEAIDADTGFVLGKGDVAGIVEIIRQLVTTPSQQQRNACRNRALRHFNKTDRYQDYLQLYHKILHLKDAAAL